MKAQNSKFDIESFAKLHFDGFSKQKIFLMEKLNSNWNRKNPKKIFEFIENHSQS